MGQELGGSATWGLEISSDLSDISRKVRPALAQVLNGRRGAGAGVVVQEDGLMITSAHVLSRGRLMVAVDGGKARRASILAVDRRRDLAALALERGRYSALELGDVHGLRPGAWLLAFGHPQGVVGGATGGSLIGVGRELPEIPDPAVTWLALALHLRPGHSGGPVVDSRSRLVGVNARMAGPNVGLAIAADEIKDFLKRAFESSSRTSGGEDNLRMTGQISLKQS